MATIRIPIIGAGSRPDDSGDVFVAPATSVHANFTNREDMVIAFPDPSALEEYFFAFRVPKDFVGSPVLGFLWTHPSGSGAVRWESRYEAAGNGDPMDVALGSAVTPTAVTAPTAEEWLETTHTITETLAVDDLVSCSLGRGTTGDTLAQTAIVHPDGVFFQYSDT